MWACAKYKKELLSLDEIIIFLELKDYKTRSEGDYDCESNAKFQMDGSLLLIN